MDKPSIKLYSVGGLDLDSELSKIANTDYINAYNMRNSVSYANQQAVPCNMLGNVLVAYTLGNAQYQCLGSLEDKQGTIFYFVWASDNNHKILRYYPNNTLNNPFGEIEPIVTFNFGWNQNERITGVDFIDQKLLNWTDSVQPRTINVVKANNTNKFKTWDVTIPLSDTAPEGITIYVTELSTGIIITEQIINVGGTRETKMQQIATAVNDPQSPLYPYFSVEACACSAIFTEKAVNAYNLTISLPLYWVVPENWYGINLIDRFFDACYYPPGNVPIAQYGQDSSTLSNFVKDRVLFFRAGYMGRDYQISKEGPTSLLAVNNQVCNEGVYNLYNYIDINPNDPALLNPNTYVIIKKITLYVQEHNDGVWSKIFDFPYCDLYDLVNGVPTIHYKFYGNEQVYSVDAAFSNTQYDNLPILANAQKFAENKITYAGITEGYNEPECVEATITPSFGDIEQLEFYPCTFNIRLCSPSYATNEPLNAGGQLAMPFQVGFSKQLVAAGLLTGSNVAGCVLRFPNTSYPVFGGATGFGIANNQAGYAQQIPLGGFGLYVPGTNFYGIGRQQNNGGLQVDEFGAFNCAAAYINEVQSYLAGGGDVYQTVTLMLPAGTHVIRGFSHLVSNGDILKQGNIYDINQGLYGLTSTNVFAFVNGSGVWSGDTETVITVTPGGGYYGTVYIADRMVGAGNGGLVTFNLFGYLMDVQMFEILGQQASCLGIEKATMILSLGQPFPDPTLPFTLNSTQSITYTDHNGYYYFIYQAAPGNTLAYILPKGANNANIGLQTDAKYFGDVGQVYDNAMLTSNEITYPVNSSNVGSVTGILGAALLAAIAGGLTVFVDYDLLTNNGSQLNPDNVNLATTILGNKLIFQNQKDGTYYNVLGQQVSVFQGAISMTQAVREVIILNTSTIYRPNFSTVIEGVFVTAAGVGICCTTAVLTETGRYSTSELNGDFNILAFADGRHNIDNGPPNGTWEPITLEGLNPPASISQELVFEAGDCLAQFPINPLPVFVSPLNANTAVTVNIPPYSSTSWFSVGNLVLTLVNQQFIKSAKRGTAYDFVIRFQDLAGRQCSCVMAVQNFYIPFFGEDLNKTFPTLFPPGTYSTGYPILTWSIPPSFEVPVWAAEMQWLRTKSKNLSFYIQWVINSVQYIQSVNPATDAVVYTTYNNFNATNIWISIDNLPIYQEQYPNNDLQYQFQVGQRLRFIADQNGNFYDQYVDVIIQQIAIDGSSLQVAYFNDLGQIQPGMRVEIYNPNTVVQDAIYYECGAVVPCTTPGIVGNTLSAFTGVFTWGDTYWVRRTFPIQNTVGVAINALVTYYVESPMVSDFYPSLDQDLGRFGVINVKFRRIYKYNAFRVSDAYLPDSGINGLSSFMDVDDVTLGREFGAILKLVTTGFVIGAVCQNKFVSNYLGAVEGAKPDGSLSIASQQGYINDSRPLIGDFGTQHPATIVEKDGHSWGADFLRGIVWYYSDNGLEEIQKFKVRNFFKQFMIAGVFDAVAAYDPFYEEYILSAWVNLNANGTFFQFGIPAVGIPPSYGFKVTTPGNYYAGQVILVTLTDTLTGQQITVQGTVSIIGGSTVWINLGVTNPAIPNQQYNLNPGKSVVQLTVRGQGYIIAYQKEKKRWTTFYNYLPDAMCGVGTNFVSWKAGQLYLHDNGPINTFYGQYYPWQLTVVATQPEQPRQQIKVWTAVFIEQIEQSTGFPLPPPNSLFNWAIPIIKNELGQLSRLVTGAFQKLEQWWHSETKKDLNTTQVTNPIVNGNELRSQTLTLQMNNDSTNKVELRGVDVLFQESKGNAN